MSRDHEGTYRLPTGICETDLIRGSEDRNVWLNQFRFYQVAQTVLTILLRLLLIGFLLPLATFPQNYFYNCSLFKSTVDAQNYVLFRSK